MTDMETLRAEDFQDAQSKAVGHFREIEDRGILRRRLGLSLRDSERLEEEIRK
jgi:hypothetical protein